MTTAKYILGFDLGTTNSVLAYAPLDAEQPDKPTVAILPLPQLVAAGTVEARTDAALVHLSGERERDGRRGARPALGRGPRLRRRRLRPAARGRSARPHRGRGQVVAGV